ncbi:hypothetical protein TU73_23870 [Pseudomonas libanensis]|uniref:Uncharacterized protein n=1 Tax=Pseudomonas libanensis TaxID=75588 RepID=A0A0R2Y1M5_9PSED|nr:hypothetical protein [Pseudomonas libanensis]KRP42070.1 hypothetical protein TU73_23870 [Pseudomonas libanensis]
MSEALKAIATTGNLSYNRLAPDSQRGVAGAIALELILGAVSSGKPHDLETELGRLSLYVDQIQEALKAK